LLLHSHKLLLSCLEQALLGRDQIDESLDADSPLAYFLSECFDRDSIHACYGRKTPADQLRQFSRFSEISRNDLPAGHHGAAALACLTLRRTIDSYGEARSSIAAEAWPGK